MLKKYITEVCILMMIAGFIFASVNVQAANRSETIFAGNPNVTMSPDGKAFTFGFGDTDCEKHDIRYKNYVHNMMGVRGLPEITEGCHYYEGVIRGGIPIAYWKLEHWNSRCVHTRNYYNLRVHGYDQMGAGVFNCMKEYPPGWVPYCAVCGEPIEDIFFYMKESVADTIGYLPSDTEYSTYFYLCPYDHSLENERKIMHKCTGVSANRYRIEYVGGSGTSGSMGIDTFYYGNASEYEGEKVSPQLRLSKCLFVRNGYVFKGWSLTDGGEVCFLESEKWETVQDVLHAGTLENNSLIKLYAVWEELDSSLVLSFAGGTVGSDRNSATVRKEYGYRYTLPEPVYSALTISFNGNGGSVEGRSSGYTKSALRRFAEWKLPQNMHGKSDGKTYIFSSERTGSVDRLTAVTSVLPITLPGAKKNGYDFAGWYNSAGVYVGGIGEEYVPAAAETLTAKWQKVTLVLNAECDYKSSVNGGKGAVDLDWAATGGGFDSAYRIYMSEDGNNWKVLGENGVESVSDTIRRSFAYTGGEASETITETGVYSITINGAEGGSFGSNLGGKGGRITLRLWLLKGEKVGISCGGKGLAVNSLTKNGPGGYGGGGTGYGGAGGGGATTLYVTDTKGNKHVVAIAGGGGGASVYSSGGPGGSDSRTLTNGYSPDGEGRSSYSSGGVYYSTYSCGGGGGYNPGYPGKVTYKKHVHSAGNPSCRYHVHTGNSADGGGCYTVKETKTERVVCDIECYYSGTSSYVCRNPGCGRTGTLNGYKEYGYFYGGFWHYTGFSGFPVCPKCGDNHGREASDGDTRGTYSFDIESTSYKLGCGLNEGFNCNDTDTETLETYSCSSSGGGGNYADRTKREYAVIDAIMSGSDCVGVISGNGSAYLESQVVGCRFDNTLSDIPAPDKAAPGEISGIRKTSKEGLTVTVSWNAPADRGTGYYFKADNYSLKTGSVAVVSNTVSRTLTTGLYGYYIREDFSAKTTVSKSNGVFTDKTFTDVKASSGVKYLHVAAVDKAGNIGSTTHILIDPDSSDLTPCWDIYTRRLTLKDGENVFSSGLNSYYVKADGKEPFCLVLDAYMDGKARETYQIDRVYFKDSSKTEKYISVGAAKAVPITDGYISPEFFSYSEGLGMIMDRYSLTEGSRKNGCKELTLTQGFVAGQDKDGLRITIIPGAEATEEKGLGQIKRSDPAKDSSNGIELIFDGSGPVISGLENFNPEKLFIDGAADTESLIIGAFDAGSGLDGEKSYVRIYNKDNTCEYKWKFSEGTDGKIRFDFSRDRLEELFCFGSFEIEVHAVDMVGNVTDDGVHGVGFDMETDVVRLLKSIDGKEIFARGESGDLYITSTGYVDSVEVIFPDELSEYNTVYDYTMDPEMVKEEVLRFMIPLYDIPEGDWDFTIKVVAHKGDEELESHPRVSVVNVSGTVLDELKTGLE